MNGLLAGGSTAVHISTSISAPLATAMRIATPSISAAPMPSRPIMKSQSAQAAPAMPW